MNILVFIYQLSLSPQELQEFFRSAAVVPCQLSNTCPVIPDRAIPEWLTLITSQFLHGGFLHIAGNMLFLWVFGNNIEDRLVISNFCFFI